MQNHPNRNTIDFDVHGLIAIRLLGASARDARTVGDQLGMKPSGPGREPDLTIRFVERLDVTPPVRSIGVDDAAFTEDAFLVLRARHKPRTPVQIPFEKLGGPCEIVCESGSPEVPLLIDILNLMMLEKGVVPIHASAFEYRGVGVLAAGWSQGGKTEALLGAMDDGARFVADDWVYVTPDGQRMLGMTEPVQIWDWHLRQLPAYRARVGRKARLRLGAIRAMCSIGGSLLPKRSPRSAPGKLLARAVALMQRQLQVDVPPEKLFGQDLGSRSASFDRLLLVVSHQSPETTVCPIDPQEVARRMAFSLQQERSSLMSYYRKFRFAFPDKENPRIERADELHAAMLAKALAGKPAYAIYHPYPMQISELIGAIEPLCEKGDSQPSRELPVTAGNLP